MLRPSISRRPSKKAVDEQKLADAAHLGHAVAQYQIARIYDDEFRTEDARHLLLCSGAQGYAPALFLLYSTHLGGYWNMQQDYRLAYLLCQAAAESGHEEAQFTQHVFGSTGAFIETPNLRAEVNLFFDCSVAIY